MLDQSYLKQPLLSGENRPVLPYQSFSQYLLFSGEIRSIASKDEREQVAQLLINDIRANSGWAKRIYRHSADDLMPDRTVLEIFEGLQRGGCFAFLREPGCMGFFKGPGKAYYDVVKALQKQALFLLERSLGKVRGEPRYMEVDYRLLRKLQPLMQAVSSETASAYGKHLRAAELFFIPQKSSHYVSLSSH